MKITILCLLLAFCSLANAQTPNWIWAKNAGGTGNDLSKSVSVDANGNVFVVGQFASSTISFGSNTFTNNGAIDLFIVKYDAQGNVLWAKSAGGTNEDYALAVATDNVGNVYVSGYFRSTSITFGTSNLTNPGSYYGDLFLVKYDANGNMLWVKTAANSLSSDAMIAISVDNQGNIYGTGHFQSSSISFGSITLTNPNAPYQEVFVVKYDSNGNELWAKGAGGDSHDVGIAICTNVVGDVFVSGCYMSANFNYNSGSLNNSLAGTNDMFLMKYDTNGNILWAKSAGGSDDDYNMGIGTQGGNVCVSGYFKSSSINVGANTLTNLGAPYGDSYIAKYDANGNVLWAKNASNSESSDAITALFIDNKGLIYGTGHFQSPSISFDSVTLTNTSAPNQDIFVVEFTPSGNAIWAKSVGGTDNEMGNAICVDGTGDILVAGQIQSASVVFANTTLTNVNNYSNDMFVAKLSKTTSLADKIFTQSMQIYPNPVTNTATLDLGNIDLHDANIQIYSIWGQKIKEIPHISGSKINLERINMNSGTYFIHISEKDKLVSVGKLLIID